jgi:hypothetical protein
MLPVSSFWMPAPQGADASTPKHPIEMVAPRRLVVAAIGAALFALVAVPPAWPAAPNAHGYWWRLQTGTGPALPPPPIVPDGGVWVASDASGQLAMSALRYKASAGDEIRALVLTVARSNGGGAVLLACSAKSSWQPAEAGAWSARPATSCDVAFVKGVEAADGNSWRFDIRGLARSGTLDVVILPPPDVNATFSIAFEKPSASSIITQRFPGSPSPSTSGSPSLRPRTSDSPRPGTSVLGEKTTQPEVTPSEPVPSASSPSGIIPRALAPLGRAGRAVWPVALAVALLLGVFAGRAVLRRR